MSSLPTRFQRRTVAAAVASLTGKGRRRFLVADEVGLGKTLVASQVILEMARRKRGRLTVFYVSSGRTVAGQNKDRLLDFGEDEPIKGEVSVADRLGLVPYTPITSDLQLYTFAPITSFPAAKAKANRGQVRERAFLHRLIVKTYPDLAETLPLAPFRGLAHCTWAGEHRLAAAKEIPSKLRVAYRKALTAQLGRGVAAKLTQGANSGLDAAFITGLRLALAHAALLLAKPDLIIFDEFQCYRDLVFAPHAPDDHVRRTLIDGPDDRPPAMLLLSATPYRLADDRKGNGATAHAEFHELLGFLGGAPLKAKSERSLERFRHLVMQIAECSEDVIPEALAAEAHEVRSEIEADLAPVLSRTERHDPVDDADRTTREISAGLADDDLDLFRALAEGVSVPGVDRSDRSGSRSDALAYWLSVPLAAQALGPSYKFWTNGSFKTAGRAPRLTRANRFDRPPDGWGNPKLRGLGEIVGMDSLSLPWTAPSLAWWEMGDRWREHGRAPKALMFSKYRATPPSVAALISLEVERRHLASKGYRKAWIAKRLSSRTNTIFNLFHCSSFLAAVVDPLAERCTTEREVRSLARRQLGKALTKLGISTRPRRKVDKERHRPSWRVLAAIETLATKDGAKGPRPSDVEGALLDAGARQLLSDDPGASVQLDARRLAAEISFVGKQELTDLVNLALGSPAIVTARALSRHFSETSVPKNHAAIASLCWGPLRRYLDNPVFWSMFDGDDIEQQIQDAIIGGNFEAVLDEHVWTRKASLSFEKLVTELGMALGLGAGSFTFQGVPKSSDSVGIRCHAALPFAGAQADTTHVARVRKGAAPSVLPRDDKEDVPARSETIRAAFNTPFWPHLLTTTSVGQEGLDFHNWCDQIVHWDLCGSPVDLEQREGRIQRYASLTIRRALADKVGDDALAAVIGERVSPWVVLKKLAEKSHSDDAGLSPWWTSPDAHVRRYIFALPGGRDAIRFGRLQDERLLYRIALGQPNPEDFIASLHREGASARLKPYLLNLSADSRDPV